MSPDYINALLADYHQVDFAPTRETMKQHVRRKAKEQRAVMAGILAMVRCE